jgi:hypothetical protein
MSNLFRLLLVLQLCSCSTVETVSTAPPDAGSSRIYDYPYEKVYEATLRAVSQLPLNIESKNEEQGIILLSKGASFFSWGERVRITLERQDSTKTKVTVLSKRALATNITAKDWTRDIFERISAELGH